MQPAKTAAALGLMAGTPPAPAQRVPFAEWDRAPWNRWSFQHVREILPTVEVWRGDGPASALPAAVKDLDTVPFIDSGGRPTTLGDFLEQSFTDGFLVLQHGKVVMERYLNGMTPRTLHLSQSMAKSVVGSLAGILADRGVINPARCIVDYVPEFAATAYREATLQHALDMTSGVAFDESYENPYSDVGRVDVASGWKPAPDGAVWADSVFDVALSLTRLDRPHGTRFDYRSIETDVLAFCLERATGKRLATLVSELIWQPMGAEESACFTVDRAGYALGDGGLNATLRDYARFGAMILAGGVFNDRQIVPRNWIEATMTGDPALFGAPYTDVTPRGAYRNQFWIEDADTRTLVSRGVFGQMIYISPAYDMVAVKLSSWPDFRNNALMMATLAAMHAIGQALR